jgi:hypothetical protein
MPMMLGHTTRDLLKLTLRGDAREVAEADDDPRQV